MALIHCPNCGATISDRAPLCPKCGTAFQQAEPEEQSYQEPQQESGGEYQVYHTNDMLNFSVTINEGFTVGIKNFVSIFSALILFVLTCWVPYINIGAFIGLVNIPIELSKGNIISPTAIFDSKYRKRFGEFMLLMTFKFSVQAILYFVCQITIILAILVFGSILSVSMYNGIGTSHLGEVLVGSFGSIIIFVPLAFIPVIILGLSWSQASYILLGKGYSPTESLRLSNKLTYGYKKTIFGISCVLAFVWSLGAMIIFYFAYSLSSLQFFIIAFLLFSLAVLVWSIGCNAIIYRNLTRNLEDCK
ncbi:MAG: zinc ribbon domain-containing protein [Muribaculaceae bacterium]|nr:zinc ribbon domain-containing protein [Muribaculaceae bacterium]